MSLIYCPECGHEISQSAIACPNCGRPINAAPPPMDTVVVTPPRREGFPPWAIVPIGLAGLMLIVFLFYAMSRTDETANSNVNVSLASQKNNDRDRNDRTDRTQTTTIPSGSSSVTAEPPAPENVQTVSVPGSQTAVPPTAVKGRVVIDAKVATRTGTTQAVRNEKFYLLDEDLETILDGADLEPIDGQTLANSFGLAVLFPDRYGDFQRQALAAIKTHIKYSGTTDASGRAQLGNVEPDSYYLFGITKTGGGFALWSDPVTISTGENVLNLTPQRITQMDNNSE